VQDQQFADPSTIFNVIFGAERFEYLIGQLRIARMSMGEYELTKDEDEEIQARRCTRAAIKMAAMLQTFVDGDKDGFDKLCRSQAQVLKETAFGSIMLHTLGHAYINFTRQQAGNVVSSSIASLAQKKHRLGTLCLAGRTVIDRARAASSGCDAIGGGLTRRLHIAGLAGSVYPLQRIRRDVHDDAQVGDSRIQVRCACDCSRSGAIARTAGPRRFASLLSAPHHCDSALRLRFGESAEAN
jgi:hypothetical protein